MSGRRRVSVRRQVEITRAGFKKESLRRAGFRPVHATASLHRRRIRTSRLSESPPQGRWASRAHLEELNRGMILEPLSYEDRRRLENEALEYSNHAALDRRVCAVTDVWVFPRSAVSVAIDELPLRAMRAVLSRQQWCSQHVVDYYDCSDFDQRLNGLLLSRRGFTTNDDGCITVWMSSSVFSELHSLERRIARATGLLPACKPPRFAIADRFVAGAFMDIDRATCIEKQAIGLAQIRGVVKVVYGGPGKMLSSHLLCWDNRNATISSQVPSVVRREQFQLILAGPMTSAQEVQLAKRHECSGERVLRAHDLLRRINPLYSNVSFADTFVAENDQAPSITTQLPPTEAVDRLIAHARSGEATIACVPDETGDLERRECTIVESQTVLMETVDAGDEQDRLAHAFASVTGVKDAYVVRRSASPLKSNDPNFMELLFPHLLTFGIGGFSTERDHRYSPRSIVLHYLNLSTNRFAEDAMFKLVMFDFLSSKRVKNNVFLRVGRDPSLATTAMRVTPAQLKTAMRNRADQRKAWKDGRTFIPAPGCIAATSLLKSITASTTKSWGSNEERESMAKKVDAISILRGAPSIFWTLTPNPDRSIVCAFWTGCELPNGRPTSLSQCGELNMPCSAEMSRMVMANTVVQARYYQICSHILIDILFGWDSRANKPKSQKGIFGYVEALVYALEQQGRLFVHHHGVAWVAGFPKTKSDWDRLLSRDETKAKFEQYCASIFSSELPVYDSIEVLHCPLGDCRGQLTAVPIPAKYKHVLKSSVTAPLVARCDVCEARFTEPEIVSALIDSQWNALDDEHKAISSVEAVIALRHRFGGLSDHPATAAVQLSRLLLKDQVHTWTHTRSCVKGRTRTKCRYRFFRDLICSTRFSSTNEMEYRRRIGNQWLNSFIALWRRILHFNMDARILWSGDGLQAARYALQYTMKRQVVLDNVAIMDLAFRTRTARELSLDSTEFSLGLGRLLSLTHASAGVMEIGGPLATTILLEGGAVTLPCLFERLVILEGLNLLDNLEVEASVVTKNHQLFTETTISKYINRPRCLENICWYDYCTWFHRAGPPSPSPSEPCSFVPSAPDALRAHLKTHGYQYAEYPHVPEIIGPRLPDSSRLRNEDYVEQTELYYRMAALLYHPFRDVRVFLNSTGSAQDHFVRWNPSSHVAIARALEFHQQFYICLQIAQQFREKQRNCSAEPGVDEEACDDDDILHYTPTQQDAAHALSTYESVPPEYYGAGVDDDMDGHHGWIAPEAAAPVIDQLYLHSIGSSHLPPDEGMSLVLSSSAVTNAQLRLFQSQAFDPITEYRVQPPIAIDEATPSLSVVATLLSSLRDLNHDRSRSPPTRITAYASIQDVSSFFKLNARQHIAFVMIAVPLLTKIVGVTSGPALPHIFDGTPLIITGAGGTGKSQIIAAVRALVASWDHPFAVSVVASTGIAAASLRGSTMHSSVGLGIKPAVVPPKIRTPSDELLRQWAPVECVIADEVSMVDLGFFGIWAESLQYVKDKKGAAFGGMLAVLMFDHCQLRTVNGVPIFRTKTKDVTLTAAQEYGSQLYQAIDKVVYLTDNMRFVQDQEWGEWLALGRLGIWPAGLRSYLNSVADGSSHTALLPRGALQAISTDNESRAAVNEAAIRVAVRLLGAERRVYVIPARLSRRLLPPEVVSVRRLPDNKTGHVPLFLQVYIGMPVRIKVNQCVSKGIANGAFGVVHHIDWETGTEFTQHEDVTWLASRPPLNIYVDVVGHSSPTRFPSIPLQWPASVMPICPITAPVTTNGPPLSIKGYPIVPAFGSTVHGIQGETRDTIVVTNLRPSHARNVDSHALYVTLSRLRTRHGLYWMGPHLTPEDYVFFRPDSDVLEEDGRLKELCVTTMATFSALRFTDIAPHFAPSQM